MASGSFVDAAVGLQQVSQVGVERASRSGVMAAVRESAVNDQLNLLTDTLRMVDDDLAGFLNRVSAVMSPPRPSPVSGDRLPPDSDETSPVARQLQGAIEHLRSLRARLADASSRLEVMG